MSTSIPIELEVLPPITSREAVITPPVTRTPSNGNTHGILVVFQGSQSRFYLTTMGITALETGEQVMARLKELWHEDVSRRTSSRIIRPLFWRATIEEASIQNLPLTDLEAIQYPVEVIISARTSSPALTAAFYRPCLLHSSGPFVAQYPYLLSTSNVRVSMLVRKELNKGSMFWILVATLVASITIGLLVGFSCSRADLGIASTSGLFGMIAIIGGVLFWIFK